MSHGWKYESGDWWVLCDVCNRKTKASETRRRWDGFQVCKNDWEPRQSLDFIRARADKIAVPFSRPRPPEDTFTIVCTIASSSCFTDLAAADCSMVDRTFGYANIREMLDSEFCSIGDQTGVADVAAADCARVFYNIDAYN